jgi:hypothetical protein
MPVIGQARSLAEIDDAAVPDAQFDWLVPWLDRAIKQQAIGQDAVQQPGHQPPVVQHIGVHQDHRVAGA